MHSASPLIASSWPLTLPNRSLNPSHVVRHIQIEEELAMRIDRLHNCVGDPASMDVNILTKERKLNSGPCDVGEYVKTYIGMKPGRGDWHSPRCADANARWRRLERTPLKLN
jgi:hypothetical protein